MRLPAKFIPVALAAVMLAPAALAQSAGTGYVMNYPNQTTSYVVPLNSYGCAISQPAETLSSPATILTQLMKSNGISTDVVGSIEIENSNSINAYTNGKKIVVTSALWNKLDTNDERAFVIGHELSHDVLNHIGKTQVRHVGLSFLDRILQRYTGSGTVANMATRLGIGLVDKRYSRGYEYQADDLGVQLMAKAGYQPCAAINVFDVLAANTTANRTPEFMRDHPMDRARVQALAKKYQLQTGLK